MECTRNLSGFMQHSFGCNYRLWDLLLGSSYSTHWIGCNDLPIVNPNAVLTMQGLTGP